MELTEGSETSTISNQTPGKQPKENILLQIVLQNFVKRYTGSQKVLF
jgi:hypothetical protein